MCELNAMASGNLHFNAMSNAETSSDEEFDLQQFGIRQALPIDDREPDWTRTEMDSVEEYLCRVR